MEITLISIEEYNRILELQQKHKVLTFQNTGYQYIKTPFTDEEKKAVLEIETILKDHITRFNSFTNFRIIKDEVQIRLQYGYDEAFTGVGYAFLRELRDGFD